MRSTTLRLTALTLFVVGVAPASWPQSNDDLPRRGAIGAALGVSDDGAVAITSVQNGSAAAEAGVRAGDVLAAIDREPITSTSHVQAIIGGHKSGDLVTVEIVRQGERKDLAVVLKSFPFERMENATLEYGHVTIGDGVRLRTILSVPDGRTAPAPAVLLLQGGGCGSIDVPWAPKVGLGEIAHTIGSRGFVTMRVDKPGAGDSEGRPCDAIGYREELSGYDAALNALLANPVVDAQRVFLVGISLGGFFAPIAARDAQVAGISVYGTIAFPPSPYPGRSDLFFREIADVDILAAWAAVDVPVQLLHGEFDDRTTKSDHEKIAEIVNARHPGYAEHRELDKLDHCWTRQPTLETGKDRCGAGEATSDLTDAVLAFLEAHS